MLEIFPLTFFQHFSILSPSQFLYSFFIISFISSKLKYQYMLEIIFSSTIFQPFFQNRSIFLQLFPILFLHERRVSLFLPTSSVFSSPFNNHVCWNHFLFHSSIIFLLSCFLFVSSVFFLWFFLLVLSVVGEGFIGSFSLLEEWITRCLFWSWWIWSVFALELDFLVISSLFQIFSLFPPYLDIYPLFFCVGGGSWFLLCAVLWRMGGWNILSFSQGKESGGVRMVC